jgi:hypothetical protein
MRHLILAALLALPLPAAAQTPEEAARQNMLLGVELCVRHFLNGDTKSTAITQAGFAFVAVDGAPGDQSATYAAPAETVMIELYQGQMAPDCQVSTTLVSAPDLTPLVANLLATRFPGVFQPQQVRGLCGSFSQIGRQLPLTVSILAAGEPHGCPENGSTNISIFFAV